MLVTEAQVAQCRVRHEHPAILVGLVDHKMLEARIGNRDDHWLVHGHQVFKRALEAATVVAQRRHEPLHVQQGKTAPCHDAVILAVLEQAVHGLLFGQVLVQVAIEQRGQRRRTTTVVVGLLDDATELLLDQWLDHIGWIMEITGRGQVAAVQPLCRIHHPSRLISNLKSLGCEGVDNRRTNRQYEHGGILAFTRIWHPGQCRCCPCCPPLATAVHPVHQDSGFGDKLHPFFQWYPLKTLVDLQTADGEFWVGHLDAIHPDRAHAAILQVAKQTGADRACSPGHDVVEAQVEGAQ